MAMATMERFQRGAGLIEVLISVLILSVGLLAVASLQIRAIKNNHSSLGRSVAVMHTYSIIDAMHVDHVHAVAGDFNVGLADAPPTGDSFAASSLTAWRQSLRTLLDDSATGSVACDNTACTVIVQWDDTRGTEGDASQQIRVEVRL